MASAIGIGPLAFPPTSSALKSLSDDIQKSITSYESAETPAAKMAALKSIRETSNKLNTLSKPLPQQIIEFHFRPNVNVVNRIAVEMGLFTALPQDGSSILLDALAQKTGATKEFILRIARLLGAFHVINQTYGQEGQPQYSHAALSRVFSSAPGTATTKHLFDNMFRSAYTSTPGYYSEYGFASPTNSKNCAFSFAHGSSDASFFDVLENNPASMKIFNEAMTATTILGSQEVISSYDFGTLKENSDGVTLVDVGGGRGHMVNEIVKQFPSLKNKVALQDLGFVLDGSVVVNKDEVKLQAYNFFEEVQPVKGSNYFFRAIFHDWSDEACRTILKNLAPAMEAHSRLLICELVINDQNPDPGQLLRDINMLLIGGKERSLKQWEELLGPEGFRIVKVHGGDAAPMCILEAVYEKH